MYLGRQNGRSYEKEDWMKDTDPQECRKVSGEVDTAPCLLAQEGGIPEHPARGKSQTLCPEGPRAVLVFRTAMAPLKGVIYIVKTREPSPHTGTGLDLSGISSSRSLLWSRCYIQKGKQECMLISWCKLIKSDKTSKSKYRQCSRPGHQLMWWFDRSFPNICSVKKKTHVWLCNIGERVRICVCAVLLQSHKWGEWLMYPTSTLRDTLPAPAGAQRRV